MRFSEFIAACGAAVLLSAPIAAAAQEKTAPQFTLRTAHYFKEDHPWHRGLAFFAKKVNDDSNGRIQIDRICRDKDAEPK